MFSLNRIAKAIPLVILFELTDILFSGPCFSGCISKVTQNNCTVIIDGKTIILDLTPGECASYCDSFKIFDTLKLAQKIDLPSDPIYPSCNLDQDNSSGIIHIRSTLMAVKNGESLKVNHSFNGISVPLEIKKKSQDVFSINIVDEHGFNCLTFNVDHRIGYVEQIATTDLLCPINTEKKGSYILDLIDYLSSKLELSTVSLHDASSIECKTNGQQTSLQFLKIMQTGAGWYESRGYHPKGDYKEYRAQIARLRDYPLGSLTALLKKASASDPNVILKSIVDQEFERFKQTHPGISTQDLAINQNLQKEAQDFLNRAKGYVMEASRSALLLNQKMIEFHKVHASKNTLSDFLSWLWESDCKSYVKIERLLFPGLYSSISNPPDLIGISAMKPEAVYLEKHF